MSQMTQTEELIRALEARAERAEKQLAVKDAALAIAMDSEQVMLRIADTLNALVADFRERVDVLELGLAKRDEELAALQEEWQALSHHAAKLEDALEASGTEPGWDGVTFTPPVEP